MPVRGKTKTEVKASCAPGTPNLPAGLRTTADFTVGRCLKDWLETLNTRRT